MRLAGTSDTGWVLIDLRSVARAIAALRAREALRPQPGRQARPSERRVAPGR